MARLSLDGFEWAAATLRELEAEVAVKLCRLEAWMTVEVRI